MAASDFKQGGRIRDGALLGELHREWKECALCLHTTPTEKKPYGLSLHHVLNKPRDDVRENLVMLCGDGVQGEHGLLTVNDPVVRLLLVEHLVAERPDTVAHLEWRLGLEGAHEWLRAHGIDS